MTTQNPTTTTNQPPPPHSPSPRAARPACAACKHQRRCCSPFCPLAPYFPADKQKEFHNVHRLFGVSNVVKILKMVPEHSRDDAMKSVIFEANLRAAKPTGGCLAVIGDLKRQIALCQTELQIVKKTLAFQTAKARLLQNFNPYDVGFSGNSIVDQTPFFENQEYSNRNQEIDSIGLVQQFLNDKLSLAEED